MKEERLAILRMLENGTISVEEAERLLNILKDSGNEKDLSESFNDMMSKAGTALDSLFGKIGKKAETVAKTVGEKAEEAKPEIKKAAKVVKKKMEEAADSIKEEVKNRRGADADDFVYEGEAEEKAADAEEVKETAEEPVKEAPETPAEETAECKEAESAEEEKSETAENTLDALNEAIKNNFAEESANSYANNFGDMSDAYEFEENRDYEAEFNKMMQESNGDIFGEVLNPINDIISEAKMEWMNYNDALAEEDDDVEETEEKT